MSVSRPIFEEFLPLLDAACDGTLLETQFQDLAVLLDSDPEVRKVFMDHVRLRTNIRFLHRAERARDSAFARILAAPQMLPPFSSPPAVTVHGGAFHSAFSLSSSWPLAYLLATVITAVGLLTLAYTYIPHPTQHIGPSLADANQHSTPTRTPEMPVVGRITGMMDCVWSAGNAPATPTSECRKPKSPVSLGDRFSIQSGLLEITYDTGAKVILQGPVTYDVDSRNGGFMSLGKLTGKATTKAARGLTIRTPTANVTDLGTEFGVEVSESGVTKACVFIGKVKFQNQQGTGPASPRILSAGQTAISNRSGIDATTANDNGARFVRTIPTTHLFAPPQSDLIGNVDYSETWTVNSLSRAGGYVPVFAMTDEPLRQVLRIEQCHENPKRQWRFSENSAITTCAWNFDPPRKYRWPGHLSESTKTGFLEMGGPGYLGFEYDLRKDFVVQFDMVQTEDRVSVTIGDAPAAIDDHSLSVFFRAAGSERPEIGVFTPSKGEADTMLHTGIPTPIHWHNYAVRFNLLKRRLTVWVDRQCRGTIDLAAITSGMDNHRTWADLSWSNKCITIGGMTNCQVWTDNFSVGSPQEAAAASTTVDHK